MTFTEELNAAVYAVPHLPRVTFGAGLAGGAYAWLDKKHLNGEVHEPGMLAAMLAIKSHRNVRQFFDIGAYYGYFSIAARQIFPDCFVTAFEPHPNFYAELRKNVDPLHTTVVHAAVSDEDKAAEVWFSAFNIFEDVDNLPPEALKPRGPGASGRSTIQFLRIDGFERPEGWRLTVAPDVVKIDVEGYQARAVRGMENTIKALKPWVLIELHDPEKLARMNTTNAETVAPLFAAGYRAHWCGNFRDANAAFERVTAMGPEHERLSLMVFDPRT